MATTEDTGTQFPLTWNLDVLAPRPGGDEFQPFWDEFQNDLQAVAAASDDLPVVSVENASSWGEFCQSFSSVAARYDDVYSHIGCHAAADAENKTFQQWEAKFAALSPSRERILTNLGFALREADDAALAGTIDADERLKSIAFYLYDRRENAALRLPREQELLAAELGVDGLHAWGRLYDRSSGELRVEVLERGELVKKSPGQVQFDSPERSVRENNFYASRKAWNSIGATCADAINHIAGTRLALYRRLKVDHLEAPLQLNRMRRETLDAMWSAVAERRGVLLQYMQKKAEMLGLEQLAWYDVTAPLPSRGKTSAGKLDYGDACRQIVDAFGRFSPDLGEFADEALRNGWIEAENRPGKRQGGFCTGFPTARQSRIFMTWTHSRDSLSTLAHELGHAYHSHVLREEPFFLQDYPMNLAETASTFAEAVLGEQQLAASNSTGEQLEILEVMLSDAVAFLMNIHARFLFEDRFHTERSGGELAPERLNELMQAAQREAYCDGLSDDGWYPGFWISKLHFYISGYPFYNFPYTFGYLLSLGVYALAGESGDEFPARYRDLLIATGCRNAEDAVQSTFGCDLTTGEFWNKSLDVVERRVQRFLELAG